jgi:hypothetical protein
MQSIHKTLGPLDLFQSNIPRSILHLLATQLGHRRVAVTYHRLRPAFLPAG